MLIKKVIIGHDTYNVYSGHNGEIPVETYILFTCGNCKTFLKCEKANKEFLTGVSRACDEFDVKR